MAGGVSSSRPNRRDEDSLQPQTSDSPPRRSRGAVVAGFRRAVRRQPRAKRNPGDFGLTPPACPRPDKTLCDTVEVFQRGDALGLLRKGIERGLVSKRWVDRFPQNIWSVTESGIPLEAELENRSTGQYHGYPMPETDPFREVVLDAWRESAP